MTTNFLAFFKWFFKILKRILCIFLKIFERIFWMTFLLILTVWLAWWLSQKPSLYRDWEPQDAILPEITWSWSVAHIHYIRNHQWKSDTDFEAQYLTGSYNSEDIEAMHYIITPFATFVWPAHTMLSFSFSDGRHLVISTEIRKEYGEHFSPLKWILNQYELQYVIATEEDAIKLRTNYRKNPVIMYPINTPKEKMQHMFRSMLTRANKLRYEPEFYNTLWNNCTTSILAHANAFRTEKIKWSKYLILPEHSDEIVYNAGLIDTELSLEEARKFFNISEKARNITEWEHFSEVIRRQK